MARNPGHRAAKKGVDPLEVWKEVNLHTRHWETLLFDSAKSYFAVISLSIGAAGVAFAWSTVAHFQRLVVVLIFLMLAALLSISGGRVVESQHNYLRRFYDRRNEFERVDALLQLRKGKEEKKESKEGETREEKSETAPEGTPQLIKKGFLLARNTTFVLMFFAVLAFIANQWEQPSHLAGARLHGADLSAAAGLTQDALMGACGDETTKLPANLTLPKCK